MNDAAGQRPDLRVSDAERDAAMSELGTHFQAGRLNPEEFEERLAAAASARTRSDLGRLFADLPHQAPPPQPASGQRRAGRGIPAVAALVVAAVVVLAALALSGVFAGGHVHMMGHPFGHWRGGPWWVILIPVLVLVRLLRRFRRGPR